MSKKHSPQPRKAAPQKEASIPQKQKSSTSGFRLSGAKFPVPVIFCVLTWLWAAWYYGSVFHISREYSFWVADLRIMNFILNQPYGVLRYIGRALLQLYYYPWLGGLLLALMLTACSWLVGYCMRLKASWRAIQYLPALAYMAVVTWHGLDIFFEARTGFIFGIPFLALDVLCIWALIIRSFSRKPAPAFIRIPTDETPRQNRIQLALIALSMAAIIGIGIMN